MKTRLLTGLLLFTLLLTSCAQAEPSATPKAEPTATREPTLTAEATATTEPTPAPTAEATATTEPTAAPTAEATATLEPTPEPAVVETEPSAIELVPFTNPPMGISGVVPAGWDEVATGVYARGAGPTDLVRLIQQAAPDTTVEQITATLLAQLGIEALPDPAGGFESAGLTWGLYVIDVSAPGVGEVKVDLALAETDSATYLVLLQTLPDEYETLHEAVFTPAVEAFATLSEEESEAPVYKDPAGLFTVPIPTNWTVEEFDGYALLTSPDEEVTVYVLAVKADDLEAGIRDAWSVVDPDFDLEPDDVIDGPVSNGAERAVTITYDTGDDGPVILAGGWLHDGIVYVEMFETDLESLQKRASQLQIISTGYTISALEETDLTGVEPLPLSDALIAELEAYILEKMEQLEVPGAAVAIVQSGELAYANGFGLRDLETREPVTPETLMMIGSTTKSMTTMLMAQLVDEGALTWDTRVVDVLPTFKVADPEVTDRITMRNLVCACTGVPRRDFEWLFNASELGAEDIIASLADYEFFTDFGEAFQYSNQMVATGGYLATLAAGGEYGDLYGDYLTLMQNKILDPLGMTSSTFSFEQVAASDTYATPYSSMPTGETIKVPLSTEATLVPIGPAGALWSNALDMANYLITELNQGVAPDGTRVVSAENLAVTWEPQVDITADASYGLGWIVEDYDGLRVLSHAGNTFGYTSELAFLPEVDLGISILTNQQGSSLNQIVRYRLLELLFQQESKIEGQVEFLLEMVEESRSELRDSLQESVDADTVAPYLGAYTNDALGDVTFEWQDGALILDAGEFQLEIRSRRKEDGEIVYGTFTPPLAGIPVEFSEDDEGNPTIIFGVGVVEYTLEKIE